MRSLTTAVTKCSAVSWLGSVRYLLSRFEIQSRISRTMSWEAMRSLETMLYIRKRSGGLTSDKDWDGGEVGMSEGEGHLPATENGLESRVSPW